MHEFIPLLDELPQVGDKGELSLGGNRITLLSRFAYAVRKYAEFASIEPKDLFGRDGWRAFRDAVKIRDRITHPKLDTNVDVSDEDLELLDKARSWWNETIDRLNRAHPGYSFPRQTPDDLG